MSNFIKITVNMDNTGKNPQSHFYAVVQPSVIIYILFRKYPFTTVTQSINTVKCMQIGLKDHVDDAI